MPGTARDQTVARGEAALGSTLGEQRHGAAVKAHVWAGAPGKACVLPAGGGGQGSVEEDGGNRSPCGGRNAELGLRHGSSWRVTAAEALHEDLTSGRKRRVLGLSARTAAISLPLGPLQGTGES